MLSILQLLLISFTGFVVSDTPSYFAWIGRLSYLNYASTAMLQNELSGLYLTDS